MAESTRTAIEQQLSELNLNEQSISSVEVSATSLQQTTWRETVTPEIRMQLTTKLFEIISCSETSQHQSLEYAKKVENDVFEAAISKTEYYHLLSNQICEIQRQRDTKRQSWRDSVTGEIRKQIAKKLVQSIVPGCDLESVDEQNSMRNLTVFAEKVECELFEAATSRSEYYQFVGEKIYNILQEDVEEQMDSD